LRHLLCLFNLSEEKVVFTLPALGQGWKNILDSTAYQETGDPKDRMPAHADGGKNIDLLPLNVSVYETFQKI